MVYYPHPLGKHESISESNHSSQDFGFSSARGAHCYVFLLQELTINFKPSIFLNYEYDPDILGGVESKFY